MASRSKPSSTPKEEGGELRRTGKIVVELRTSRENFIITILRKTSNSSVEGAKRGID